MAPSARRMAAPVLVVLLLLAAEVGAANGVVVEERKCLSQSHTFEGLCLSSNNCAKMCRTENFPDGECKVHHATRKCFCTKAC